jgi:hypothetical protein
MLRAAWVLAATAGFFSLGRTEDGHTFTEDAPSYVRALSEHYGQPNQNGFGSTVLFASRAKSGDELGKLAAAAYRYFMGPQWERRGEAVWLGPWKMLHQRNGPGDIVAELRSLPDTLARSSGDMILDSPPDPEAAHAALSQTFDGPEVRELLLYSVGDGDAMSGLLIAVRRDNGEATFLVFLLD